MSEHSRSRQEELNILKVKLDRMVNKTVSSGEELASVLAADQWWQGADLSTLDGQKILISLGIRRFDDEELKHYNPLSADGADREAGHGE